MNAETRRSIAIHEAGHAVAAWTFAVEMRLVSIRETDDRAGVVFFNASGEEDDLTCATILVSGEIAQAHRIRMSRGRRSVQLAESGW
jgi:ATP-dependent Zn protease